MYDTYQKKIFNQVSVFLEGMLKQHIINEDMTVTELLTFFEEKAPLFDDISILSVNQNALYNSK